MEQEDKRGLTDADRFPDDPLLQQVLGEAFPVFLEVRKMISELGMALEWRYYRDGQSWLGKVTFKKKTVVWMSVWQGFLQATVYMHIKDREELENLPLEEALKGEIQGAQPSGKLLPCTVRLRAGSRLADLRQLVEFKLSR